jgi:pyruvate/2-oxoglutarate dehydrogenase complex dihydrolipoamide dehydrogenase (E3) component
MPPYDYDVLIIGGGGSGGFTAATTALKSGARVAMIEAGRLGGLCILAGCMPSKTLLHHAAQLKGQGPAARRHHPAVMARKRTVVEFLAGKREEAVAAKQKQGLVVIPGRARLADPHTVEVEGRRITADKIVVATGSVEMVPPLEGLRQCGYLDSRSLLELDELPESVVVLGGGALALEMAQYLVRMGVETTIVQRSPHLLSSEAPEVGQTLAEALAAEGARIYTDTALERIERDQTGCREVHFRHQGRPTQVSAQAVLLALGRRPNTAGLGLEGAGVELERGAVAVNRFMQTSQPHIFAAGDVTGVRMVVNLAVLQGEIAGHNATHPQAMREIDDRVLPQAVYTDPQFARVGLSRAECEQKGLDFAEATYKLSGLGVTRTYPQEPRGFMTMRAERKSRRILGAEIVAPEASLLIHEVAVAMQLDATPDDIAAIPYAHPCLSELVNLCAGRLARALG